MIRRFTFTYLSLIFIFLSLTGILGQDKTITGKVIDSDNKQPLPGVTVLAQGTGIGVVTDLTGNYSIDVPDTILNLEFRFVGMQTIIEPVDGRMVINIEMQSELYSVSEVVVTALGITRETKSLGYSVTAVNSDDLTQANDKSMLNALSGKVAGVNITSASGAPGASTRILIRGVSSLSGGNQPLFIIDNVPVSNSSSGSSSINGGTDFGNKINDLNVEDIESVSFLKGASGTALYGSRAANGVIIITTKKGRLEQRTKVNFASSIGFESPLRLVEYQNKFGQGIYGNSVLYENMSWGPEFDDYARPWGNTVDNAVKVKPYKALPDNVKEFFERGRSLNNSLSISGGTSRTTYYMSYSNIIWDGIFPTDADSYNKHTVSLRGSHAINDWLKNTTSLNYIRKKNSFVPTGQGEQSVYNQVMQTPRDISLRELSDLSDPFNIIDNYYSLYTVNPYHILENNGNENIEDRFYGSIEFELDILEGFNTKWRIGGDVSNENRKEWRERVQPEGNNELASVFDPGSVLKRSASQFQLNSDLILTYKKTLGNWDLSAMAGHSINQRKASVVSTSVNYLTLPEFPNLSNSTERPNSGEYSTTIRMVGVFGGMDLSYKALWFLSLTARNEWSSTLPVDNNSYFFPGVNTSLLLSELVPGIKNILPFAKLRASWARVGNDASPYSIYPVYEQGYHTDGYGYLSYPLINSVNSYDVGDRIGNPNLKPEMTTEYEVGLDLRFFENRLSFDVAYYNRYTVDLIWPSPVAYSSGYTYRVQNLGKMTNYGIEALVGFTPVRTNDFSWDFSINFTRNFNEVNYLNNQLEKAELNALRVDGGQQISWLAIPGMPVGVFEARTVMRTDDGKIVVDNRGLPRAAEDLAIYGNSQYKYFGGITSTIKYKGLSLSGNLDFRVGGIMYSRTKEITLWAGTVPATLYNNREPFIIPNSVYELETDENGDPVYVENTSPIDRVKIVEYWGNGGLELDGASLIDKTFVKLREVVLSYTLPSKWLEKMPMESVNIGVSGKNLYLWTPKDQTYIDSEMTTFGNDLLADFGEYGAQPSVRSILFNLKIGF